MERMQSLLHVIRNMMDDGFTGHVKINFSQGSIGRVEKIEELVEITSFIKIRDRRRIKGRLGGEPGRHLFTVRKPCLGTSHEPHTSNLPHLSEEVQSIYGDGM